MTKPNESPGHTAGDPPSGKTLGTFAGVFTPSILTILGIILFLRLGYVVGAAGLPRALLIILIANGISILTSISLSAIATNLRVKGGGDYYVISRTLGVEFGGALGIVLFLAQSVSIAFYAIGFGEAIAAMAGAESPRVPQVVAMVAVSALFTLAWLGADWATRFQYVVMAVLFTAIGAFFVGGIPAWDTEQLRSNLLPAGDLPFWTIFAIFFPAVTGFTQGVSMSGDLKDPGKSLPLGTFLAVGLSLVVYVAVALVFAASLPGAEMVNDYGAIRRVSGAAWLVDAGVIAATLSSALASFLGAPRILQSLAKDRVFPILDFFAAGHGPQGNPRRGVVLAAAIACGTIALGNLNVIAPVVSMFFLISYGLLNYATYFEAHANSPSFRPRFRFFHEKLSLLGCLGCLGAMLAIHPTAGAVAVAVLFALHKYVSSNAEVERWADADRSHRFQRVREDLYAIASDLEHPRYWRPVLLAFSDNPDRRERILRFASWLEGHSGFTTAIRIIEGEGPRTRKKLEEAEKELQAEIDKGKFPAFARAIAAPDVDSAVPVLLQAHGLGTVRANTVLLNWFDRGHADDAPGLRSYGHYLRLALRFGCNVVILAAGSQDFAFVEGIRPGNHLIDVWYRHNATGRLMLLLAYLMTRSDQWDGARIRLFAPATKDKSREEALEELKGMLEDVRIDAEPEIVDDAGPHSIIRHSADSSVVFLPFRLGDEGPTSVSDGPLGELAEGLGITALVLAAQDIVLDSEPEEGVHGKIAEAVDAADKAEKTALQAEEDAVGAAESARDARMRLEAARDSQTEKDRMHELETEAREADEEAERTKRRAAKARAKADDAAEEAEALTGHPARQDDDEPDHD